MSSDPASAAGAPDEARAIRLTVAYDETGVRVIDRTPVEKPVPPQSLSFDLAALPAHAVVAELRGAGDATVYRQIVEQALPETTEVFEQGVERGMWRHPVPQTKGVFTLIVPDDAAAESVVLLAGPGTRGAGLAAGPSPPGGPLELTRAPLRGDGNG
jgi:hypothetical protein